MTTTKPERAVVITDDTTPAELVECLANLNRVAAGISRRGRAYQIDNPEYDRHHERINAVLTDYLNAPA